MTPSELSLQDRITPRGRCFGCGPANERGLRMKSFERGKELVCEFQPEEWHQAFPGVVNGGILGALLDCHSNWAAAWGLQKRHPDEEFPYCVTFEYAVRLWRPTPSDRPLLLRARPVEFKDERTVVVDASLHADGLCASCRGTFVAVGPGHPGYHRWE